MERGRNLSTVLVAVAALVVVGVAATRHPAPSSSTEASTSTTQPAPPPAPALRARALTTLVLTLDRLDRYDLTASGESLHFRARPTDSDANLRFLVWDRNQRPAVDEEVCATWVHQSDTMTQQGFAFRIRHDGRRWRTITLTKNTLFGMSAYFNVHTWDSARPTAIATVDHVAVPALFAHGFIAPFPWHLCGRVVGSVVTVKAWTGAGPEPSWSDPTHAGSIRLPAGWDYAGRAGWYAGHLPPGGTTDYTAISTPPVAAGA